MTRLTPLVAIVGQDAVVEAEGLAGHFQDYWTSVPTQARALVSPASVEELAAVLAWCNENCCPVVPEGGRTNLVRGTWADTDSILLSLARMSDIDRPDVNGMTVEAGAGVVLQALQERCAVDGLRFGLDFGARGSATLGGALAMNAGGLQALRYGVARDQVLGLQCVLADGTVLSHLAPLKKDNTGYDLKQLFIGSEGTLGIITRAALLLHPAPVTSSTALLAFLDFDAMTRTLSGLRRGLRGTLSSFEVMWADFFEFNVAAVCGDRRPISGRYPFYCLCEAEGFEPGADEALFELVIMTAIEAGDVKDAVITQSSAQRNELWRIREDFEVRRGMYTAPVAFDVSLPQPVIENFVNSVRAALNSEIPGLEGFDVYGHLGDGNLHLTVGVADAADSTLVKILVNGWTRTFGGSISAEHGIGLTKRNDLHYSRSDAEMALMRQLKLSLDAKNILNPGKLI